MPFYMYECKDCGKTTEAFQKMSDEPLKVCPSCGGHLKKLLSNVGVVFKGGGYYSTDSKKTSSLSSTSTVPSKKD
ncbi:MAG TPA: zinc ribbon domain-containing protein [Mesotoga infera]|jgi:putative FmdB family regulatory protein|uniref:Putative regulatory protein, FmdB family n=1 Tax=Mesotoga infera TaxID=1236046 RepID=A0A7Z7PN90_9BACT|nr:FmdB family zinc ribbon protein [Mesotoga infera]MBP8661533.1 zinc ribbon domain-containing protein [Mesotoga sp.]NLI05925.1 zinc ribbon domain-containing protein [Thermotogaceae bacterium]SSC11683.1 putative regulatory protein, FmdB family [Mesotoga infera]HNR79494.1 zinc ribbon domain-containing protein [Mesotoga infera]HNS66088.1 zinc ribbon domain-containing protein [Mesotoga infera]